MMKKTFLIMALVVAVMAISLPAKADVWQFDKMHTRIGFSVRHMVISNVSGEFGDYSGTVNFDGKNVEGGSIEFTLQVASINTDVAKRDAHLKSPDFFDVEKYPTMIFKSKKITKGAGDKFTVVGDLTMKAVTKEVTLDCTFNGTVTDPGGNTHAGFSATTTINRQDFGVSWANKLQDGSLIVSNDVKITLDVELVKSK
jgi:polyisoprenoid-binding protein YceI